MLAPEEVDDFSGEQGRPIRCFRAAVGAIWRGQLAPTVFPSFELNRALGVLAT